jgi:hypothetical protein
MNRSLYRYHFEINESFLIHANKKPVYDTLVLFLVGAIVDNRDRISG